MGAKNGRQKGNLAERHVAARLGAWWSAFEQNAQFVRTVRYPVVRKIRPVEERFFEKVSKTSDCWIWIGLKNDKGYGRFGTTRAGGMVLAHRFAWKLAYGELPVLCVLHRCDNPSCVRIEHLFLGTRRDNNRDMDLKGRRRSASGEKSGRRKRPERWPRGAAIRGAKLNEERVREIRDLYNKGGTSYARLGAQFGVGRTTIENIIKGRKWVHVR